MAHSDDIRDKTDCVPARQDSTELANLGASIWQAADTTWSYARPAAEGMAGRAIQAGFRGQLHIDRYSVQKYLNF